MNFPSLRSLVHAMSIAVALGSPLSAKAAADLAARLEAQNALLAEQWEWQLKENPEFATILGDDRYNDRWSDYAPEHFAQQKQDLEHFLARFEAIDPAGFPEPDRLNRELMLRKLRDALDGLAFKNYEMPLDQFNGVHLQLPQLVSVLPLDSLKHYADYLARLHRIPALLDQVVQLARLGQRDGLMPPQYLLEKVARQCRAIAQPAGEANVFGRPAAQIPKTLPAAERQRLHDAIVAAVDREVRPAYARLADFVEKDYAPHGRREPGLWALPDGPARYRYAIRTQTTTAMDPEAIHELGLKEVARIEGEMTAIAKKLGYADLAGLRAALKSERKYYASSRQQIVDLYRKYIAQMQPRLPELFGLLPKAPVEVRPMQEYREKEAAAAEYQQGTADGSRPGIVYVNTGDYAQRSLVTIEDTAYHEGVPGHHLQIAIAQTLPLPPFRQQADYTAYIEGWALYAERLGKDLGFYQDPVSDYGRLAGELLRASRLVLDTGVHDKRWTREQMIAFFRAHTVEDEPDIQAETDRYIAMPAQALAYKLGQLKFLELRARAQRVLGEKFDLRAFHDEMLGGGALPLDVLETRFDAWLEAQRAKAANAG